ncbi:MAG: DUF1343 domain-containing protein [Spirochaetota bacterium]
MSAEHTRVKTGNEVLFEEQANVLNGRRIGLATNPTGVSADLTSTIDIFSRHSQARLKALFGPEHGIRAGVQDGIAVSSGTDTETGLPVYSLYGPVRKPTAEMLRGLDLLVFDIQDVGCRYYTYLYTLSYLMEAAVEHKVPILVLDRPNPLGGLTVEGNILDRSFSSFIGRYPLPVLYGLTIGELALYFNREFGLGAELTVVPMRGWRRHMWFDQTGLPWVPPSPNMPTLDTATVYPGTCLVEGTNLSEGRGTTKPFEVIGAPWIKGRALADALNALSLGSVRFRPVDFTPTYSKFNGEWCSGVQVHVLDRLALRPVETGLHILATIKDMYPQPFEWLPTSWEGQPPQFDLLMGTERVRQQLDDRIAVADIVGGWEEETAAFRAARQGYCLYQ